ncbi:MAG: peptide deformylase [Alphaproteobacteria bacterium]|nr:peptide deformylase [Alphaproteobacteria bacterium]
MALRPILIAPDPRLKRHSEPVGAVDDGVRQLVADMFDTMYAAPGVGLAAIQIGLPRQVIVIDLQREDAPRQPLALINPVILSRSPVTTAREEGCLSLPEQFAEVIRAAAIAVRFLDREGEVRTLVAEGALATCIQHEVDHLDGVLFVDHISPVKRSIILRKLVKARRHQTLAPA